LQTLAIFLRRHSQLLFAIAAEVGQGIKIHHFSNLRNGETLVVEQVLEYGHGVTVDIRGDAVTRHSADGGRKRCGGGWYQEWGKPAVELKEGVVIEVPEGVKHWHGAAKNSWVQHLTYHKNLQPNPTNEWLEAVDDETYNKLK